MIYNLSFHLYLLTVMGCIFSVFSFCVCLFVAQNLGRRLEREQILAEIIGTYCDIREFNSRCKIILQKIRSSPHSHLLGTLPSELQKVSFDTDQVFLEAFRSFDHKDLIQTKKALQAICLRIKQIMIIIELRLRKVKGC